MKKRFSLYMDLSLKTKIRLFTCSFSVWLVVVALVGANHELLPHGEIITLCLALTAISLGIFCA